MTPGVKHRLYANDQCWRIVCYPIGALTVAVKEPGIIVVNQPLKVFAASQFDRFRHRKGSVVG